MGVIARAGCVCKGSALLQAVKITPSMVMKVMWTVAALPARLVAQAYAVLRALTARAGAVWRGAAPPQAVMTPCSTVMRAM